jgi:hypothetical protein
MARYRFCSFYFAVSRLWKTLDFRRESAILAEKETACELITGKGVLEIVKWTKLRTASVVGICVLLAGGAANGATQQAITEISNANTGTTVIALPPDVRQELVKQKAAMRAIYLEFTETSRGSLTNWDYSATSVYTAYFAESHFYRQEQLPPGYEHYKNEVAFDGKTIWRRDTSVLSRK